MGNIEQRTYTVKDVIRTLRISRKTLYNWERRDRIPKAQRDPVSRYRIYREEDLRRLLQLTKRRPGALPEDHWKREYFVRTPLQVAITLRKALPVSEVSYRHLYVTSHSDPQARFLYEAVDEISKAAIAIYRWKDLLDAPDDQLEGEGRDENLTRIVLESTIDEQAMWTRKLSEVLVNLICFKEINGQPYYRLFLALAQLDAFLGIYEDWQEFYDCDNENLKVSIRDLRSIIDQESSQLDWSRVWFVDKPITPQTELKAGRLFTSFRYRFRKAMKQATPEEKWLLGVSYERVYSGSSRAIHAVTGSPKPPIDIDAVDVRLGHVGLLAIHAGLRTHELRGIPLGKSAQQFKSIVDEGTTAAQMMQQLKHPSFKPGDLVLAVGDLALVLEERVSQYGYQSCRVRFLAKPPLPEAPEENFPAAYVQLLFPREQVRPYFEKGLVELPGGGQALELIRSTPDDKLFEAIQKTLIELANQGLLPAMLQQSQTKATTLPG